MRLEHPHRTERFGAVHIRELQRVVELDSGEECRTRESDDLGPTCRVSTDAIRMIERDLVVVVPCMNETRRVIEGVLAGIPHDALIILVSNSDRQPVDRYGMEAEAVEQFCRFAERPAVAIHQRDPGLAAALKAAGMPEIVDGDGLVRSGKGEAMLIGMALASLCGRRFVGYLDADDYVPGAVLEYCKAYASGLYLAGSPFGMVRISWGSKPKLRDGRVFYSRQGRSSEVTNRFLNRLVGEHSGFDTDVIATGNAGEHAFTLELGLRLRLASGFAVEPFHFIDLFEQYGGVLEAADASVMAATVPVVQIESRNPHFHDDRGEDHVRDMRNQALHVIYHSKVCLPGVRREIRDFLIREGGLAPDAEPPTERVYPPVGTLAIDMFLDVLKAEAASLRQVRRDVLESLPTFWPNGSHAGAPRVSSWRK